MSTAKQQAEELARKCAEQILASERIQNLYPSALIRTGAFLASTILTTTNLSELIEAKEERDRLNDRIMAAMDYVDFRSG